MGTAESIFLDHDEGHHEPPPLPMGSRQHAQQHRPPTAPQRPITLQKPPPSDPPPQRRTIIQQNDSKAKAPPTRIFQLNGMVLGLSKSGKRTLLQRLEGKEPVFSAQRNSKSSGDADSGAKSEESTVASAPYQPPPHLPAFDERIQLQVQASKKVSKNSQADFYVVLIDPRYDRMKLGKYLAKTLHSALRAQGYVRDTATKRPFCLCLLRNFRDLIPEDDTDACISESDLTASTMEILQDYPDLDSLLLQCTDTSLLNFYGLGKLHHFIYQAYVQRKQYDLEQELRRVQEAATRSRHEAPPPVSYEEYLVEIERLLINHSNGSSGGHRNNGDDETATTATSSGGAGRRKMAPLHGEQSSSRRNRASSGESSSTLPSIQQSMDNAKDALEAFLESDSDDGEHANVQRQDSGSEGDSDEDDFFYDESGIRNDAARYKSKDSQSKSEASTDVVGSSGATKESIPMDRQNVRAKQNGTKDEASKHVAQDAPASNNVSRNSSARVSDDDHLAKDELGKSQNSGAEVDATVNGDLEQLVDQVRAAPDEKAVNGKQGPERERSSPDSPQQSAVPTPLVETSELQGNASDECAEPSFRKKDDEDDDSDCEFFIDEQTTGHEAGASVDVDIIVEEHRAVDEDCRDSDTQTDAGIGSDEESNIQLLRNETDTKMNSVPNDNETNNEHINEENDFNRPVQIEIDEDSDRTFFVDKDEMKVASATRGVALQTCAIDSLSGADAERDDDEEDVGNARIEAPLHAKRNAAVGVVTERPNQALEEAEAVIERRPNVASDVKQPPETAAIAATGQLSEAARAAIAAAQHDFERMMQVTGDKKAKKPKKKKKDDREKKSKKENKTKHED